MEIEEINRQELEKIKKEMHPELRKIIEESNVINDELASCIGEIINYLRNPNEAEVVPLLQNLANSLLYARAGIAVSDANVAIALQPENLKIDEDLTRISHTVCAQKDQVMDIIVEICKEDYSIVEANHQELEKVKKEMRPELEEEIKKEMHPELQKIIEESNVIKDELVNSLGEIINYLRNPNEAEVVPLLQNLANSLLYARAGIAVSDVKVAFALQPENLRINEDLTRISNTVCTQSDQIMDMIVETCGENHSL